MKRYILLLLFPFYLVALQQQPWLGNLYEFDFMTKYQYSRFSSVANSTYPLQKAQNSNLLQFDLDFTSSPSWEVSTELEFVDTTRQAFSFRSFALQGKKLWLDDIIGDVVSLTTSINGRYISSRSKRDISCPYGSDVDIEGGIAIGKEIDKGSFWRFRGWGYAGVGIANMGSPWINGKIYFEGNWDDLHKWKLFLKAQHGYGKKSKIDIDNFNGYASTRARFINLGASYGYRLGVWGTLSAKYEVRVLAKVCPKAINYFAISYLLPFSF
jgi:hypothetical protein